MKTHTEMPKNRETQLKFLHDFISGHKLAVLSSIAANYMPESSVMGFAVAENMEIIVSSFATSRKYQNIKNNPNVALVIGWEGGKTVQYEGTASELSQEEAEKELETSLAKIPSIAKYLLLEHQVLYRIKPNWIRYSNMSVDPWERFEVKF